MKFLRLARILAFKRPCASVRFFRAKKNEGNLLHDGWSSLVGAHDHPEIYRLKMKPGALSEAERRDNAHYSGKALIARRPQTEEPGFAARLVETAKEEKELEFLDGPFGSEEEVSNYLGHSNWRGHSKIRDPARSEAETG
eukprot:s2058_g4.t1